MNTLAPSPSAVQAQRHIPFLILLFLVSFGIKFSIWQLHPQIFNDTPGYLVPALNLLSGRGYGAQENGYRAPTYPLFLASVLAPLDRSAFDSCTDAHRAVCIGNGAEDANGLLALRVIVIANIVLGLAITLFLYFLGWGLAHNYWVAFFFGAGYAWNVATAFWETSLLTETFTTFLIILVSLLALRIEPKRKWLPIFLGAVLGALALCHQLYLTYWLVPTAIVSVRYWREGFKAVARLVAPLVLIPPLCVLLWSTFNYVVNDSFTPSTLSGYVLIQMVAPAMENAPAGYDGITQTYVGYRDAQIQQVGTHAGAIYRAWRDIMKETDLTWSQVSAKLTTLSLYLAYHYPAIYVASVSQVAGDFWEFAFYHYDPIPEGISALAARFTDPTLQTALNILFWLSPFVFLVVGLHFSRRSDSTLFRETGWGFVLLCATVWYAAVVSSLTNFGDNARYRVHVMPMQYGVVVLMLWLLVQSLPRLRSMSWRNVLSKDVKSPGR